MSEFSNKHAVVTGSGSGIGRATAIELAKGGAVLSLLDLDPEGLQETARLVEAAGSRAETLQLDVTDSRQVNAILAKVELMSGVPDYLVNAAGVFFAGPVHSLTDEALLKCFSVNTFGPFYTCRALLPGMTKRGSGAIVNVSSLHAQNGQPNAASYAASKGAVMAFTKSLAREVAADGIRANIVAPGPIDTPFWRRSMVTDDAASVIARRVKTIPLGRLGEPVDVARVIVFLLSSSAAYMTGQVVTVGGGEIMP